MKDIKDSVRKQVATLLTKIEMANVSALAIYEYNKKSAELINDIDAWLQYYADNQKVAEVAGDKDLVKRLQATLKQDLVKVETKFLVCDQPRLTSPAGFHASDRVFIQPTIAIHLDSLDGFKVPAGTQSTLFAHDIDAIAAKD